MNGRNIVEIFSSRLNELQKIMPEISSNHLGQYLHDILIYDRGIHLAEYINDCHKISKLYERKLIPMALRTLTKTYFIKDEVFIAHVMISPMRAAGDHELYKNIGSGFKKVFINRPSFDIGSKKIEFDFSPKPWMLKLMRHARFLRPLMPVWHKAERAICLTTREKIIGSSLYYSELKALENIKGYREVKYESARL